MLKATPFKRLAFFIVGDIAISFFTLYLAYNLRFNFYVPYEMFSSFFKIFATLVLIKILIFGYFKIYNIAWRFFSLSEVKKLIFAHIVSYFLLVILLFLFRDFFSPFARSIIIIDFFLSLFFISLLRFSKRIIIESGANKKHKNTLIIGADNSIKTLLQDRQNLHYSPIVIVDENRILENTYISNLRVYFIEHMGELIDNFSIEAAIISKHYPQEKLLEIFNLLKEHNIEDIKLYNSLQDSETKELKDITVEDLLARKPKDLDKNAIQNFIKDKIVLITGAGGSIGSEISRQCKNYGAKQLVLLDHSEFNLYSILEELQDENIVPVMQSVRNFELLEKTFAKYKPQIVIHAAAYKHVPLVEHNVQEAILNNVLGTKNVIDLSIRYGADKFVLISTDKAVRPTNVMGATKRICELYAQNVEPKKTEIVAVRFGNVLGSSGSVIPKFKAQIEAGKNITVTHPEITRYFMLIPEACELVLQASSIGRGGEIFILDMGEPVKIVDLAQKMISLSGRDDIEIDFSGLRAGEKLYEELLLEDSEKETEYPSIMVAGKTIYDIDELNSDISLLIESDDKIAALKKVVKEFNHNGNSL